VTELLQTNEDEAVDYILKAIPFIKEYAEDTHDPGPDTQEKESHFSDYGFQVTGGSSKNDIFCRYMGEMEDDYTYYMMKNLSKDKKHNKHQHHSGFGIEWECETCHVSKLYDQTTASLVCPSCGVTSAYLELNRNNLSFDEQINRQNTGHCAYKRVNHFSEWINSLQARESTVIPDDVLDAVRLEFKKHRLTSISDVTPVQVKKYLKKLRLSKWYEHVHSICHALGTPPPVLSPSLELTLKNMFAEIQAPFNKHVKRVAPTRKNFLSYAYVLYKFCELLGEEDLMRHFTLLKSHEKLHQMDMIWKCICEELQWEFVPSL
jgi:hypothetical protein